MCEMSEGCSMYIWPYSYMRGTVLRLILGVIGLQGLSALARFLRATVCLATHSNSSERAVASFM